MPYGIIKTNQNYQNRERKKMQEAKTYLQKTTIKAIPLQKGKYFTMKGWDLPDGENGAESGYLIEHGNKKAKSFMTWMDKEQFLSTYQEV